MFEFGNSCFFFGARVAFSVLLSGLSSLGRYVRPKLTLDITDVGFPVFSVALYSFCCCPFWPVVCLA